MSGKKNERMRGRNLNGWKGAKGTFQNLPWFLGKILCWPIRTALYAF